MSLSALFSGCANLPDPPEGELCSHYQERSIAICNNIKDGQPLADVPIAQTDKWIMFSPQTWNNIMDYIDKLKIMASQQDMKRLEALEKVYKDADRILKKTNERRGRE